MREDMVRENLGIVVSYKVKVRLGVGGALGERFVTFLLRKIHCRRRAHCRAALHAYTPEAARVAARGCDAVQSGSQRGARRRH